MFAAKTTHLLFALGSKDGLDWEYTGIRRKHDLSSHMTGSAHSFDVGEIIIDQSSI